VGPIHLFDLAAQQARWLSVSQAVIANNVANANTPGFQAQTVRPFADVLAKTQIEFASTNPNHLGLPATEEGALATSDQTAWETTESGNSVSLEQEMIKAGDVRRDFSLNTNIVRAFHGMLMASVKSS
jgi:flagellar basal-body rod protein FlgB